MPWIVDYSLVLDQMRTQGLRSLYHNSGSFGFAETQPLHTVGWIGPPDETIRPEVRAAMRSVPEPYALNLAELATWMWQKHLPGRVWLMPMSHWGYELEFGSRDWLPAVLENAGVDPGLLKARNTGDAIEFSAAEALGFEHVLQRLLDMLLGSDFMIAFPGRAVLCTLHHHQQLWWSTPDAALAGTLKTLVRGE
jgi:hypothetical protein